VTVDPEKKEAFEEIFAGIKLGHVGFVTESPTFCVHSSNGSLIIEEDIHELKACWKKPFGELI
jgi:hypothetical protein